LWRKNVEKKVARFWPRKWLVSNRDRHAEGGVYLGGNFTGTIDFDPGAGSYLLTSPGTLYDAFVTKLDTNGNFAWATSLGASWSASATGIAVRANGEVVVVGGLNGTGDFDPTADEYLLSGSPYTASFVWELTQD